MSLFIYHKFDGRHSDLLDSLPEHRNTYLEVSSMRIVKTMNDISLLRQAEALSPVLLNEINRQLTTVYENVNDRTDIEEFSLRDIGPIVVLEPGDNVRDLEEIGLNPEDGGLLGAAPEWVELLERAGQKFYSMVIVLNNEYAVNIYCPPDAVDDETQRWLEEQAGIA